MSWTLKWGEHVKSFEAQAKKTGVVARPMQNRPRLQQRDAPYYDAFHKLSRCRPSAAMGSPGAIPVSEVLAFCQLVGVANTGERLKYLSLIQDLDQICLEHWAEEHKKSSK